MTRQFYTFLSSPLGRLYVQGDDQFVTGLYLPDHKRWTGPSADCERRDTAFDEVAGQLEQFFAGTLRAFDVPLKLKGTSFQQCVWCELAEIPFGETVSYAQLARRVGKPNASRAVGHANARNPVSIIVPCHRVVGSTGKLTGYGGGIPAKQWLLDWERRVDSALPCRSMTRSRGFLSRLDESTTAQVVSG